MTDNVFLIGILAAGLFAAGYISIAGTFDQSTDNSASLENSQAAVDSTIRSFSNASNKDSFFQKLESSPGSKREIFVIEKSTADVLVDTGSIFKGTVNALDFSDAEGKELGREILEKASISGALVSYKVNKLGSPKSEEEVIYIKINSGYIFGTTLLGI